MDSVPLGARRENPHRGVEVVDRDAAPAQAAVRMVLAQPASAVFLAVSLLFYLAGYRRAKPAGRFAA